MDKITCCGRPKRCPVAHIDEKGNIVLTEHGKTMTMTKAGLKKLFKFVFKK